MGEISIEALALGIAGLFLAVVGLAFRETLKQFFNPVRLARRIRAWARGEVPAPGTHFTILVADLDGDTPGAARPAT